MDVDTPVGSLSKKPRRVQGADASDDEEPGSSPVASSPLLTRSSPPPPEEEVKEVTTGVKEIELDREPDAPLSDPSEVVELAATLDTEPYAESEEEPKATVDVTPPEGRPGTESAPRVEESQDPVEGDSTEVKPVERLTDDTKDTTEAPEEDVKPFPADSGSPPEDSQVKSTAEEPLASEDKPDAET